MTAYANVFAGWYETTNMTGTRAKVAASIAPV